MPSPAQPIVPPKNFADSTIESLLVGKFDLNYHADKLVIKDVIDDNLIGGNIDADQFWALLAEAAELGFSAGYISGMAVGSI